MSETILIVEDNDPTRTLLTHYLAEHGCKTLEARDGNVAIEALKNGGIDGVFLDILMPERDGFEVLNWLRNNNVSIPVIVFTEAGIKHDLEYASMSENLGALRAYDKPITPKKVSMALDLIRSQNVG